jgi:hypothetical protein
LRAAFVEAVNDYLATCEKWGRAPQKPYSGKLMLRVPPEVHAHAAMMAEAHGKSLNQWQRTFLCALLERANEEDEQYKRIVYWRALISFCGEFARRNQDLLLQFRLILRMRSDILYVQLEV